MTEAEWLACAEVGPMFRFLNTGKVRERKLRLFAVACCLRIWEMIPDENCRRGVILAESFADGLVDPATMEAASEVAEKARLGWQGRGDGAAEAASAAFELVRLGLEWSMNVAGNSQFLARNPPDALNLGEVTRLPVLAVGRKADHDAYVAHWGDRESRLRWLSRDKTVIDPRRDAEQAEDLAQANLLRDILGNPFRRPTIDPDWHSWDGGTVPSLARAIYEEKAFDRMPILGDALEEAGCSDDAILDHCRRDSGHVRGCWLVDALLGRR